MMTIIMIDVEAGKEDLFDRLSKNLMELNDAEIKNRVEVLYLAKCYTHSDISLMVEVKDPEALPPFIVNILLPMEGVWDIQLIPLLNPKFFNIPKNLEKGKYQHFTITLDVKSDRTRSVFNHLQEMAADDKNSITFLAYSFYSYDNDIIMSMLAPDIEAAGKFMDENIRSIDGVIDTFLWQIQDWRFIVSENKMLYYINSTRENDPIEEDLWKKTYKDLMDSYLCAC